VGWGLVAGGGDVVIWSEVDHSKDFPLKGISAIVISWVFSPVVSGIIAAIFFLITRTFILRSKNSYSRAYNFLPVLVFICIFVNMYYILDKGVSKQAAIDTKKSVCGILVLSVWHD
jgi:solute carrier family 20 (sodium-dependent phosphate transporter)